LPFVDWVPCDGRLLDIRSHLALFNFIGNAYGGDGRTSFAIPNLPPVAGLVYGMSLSGSFQFSGAYVDGLMTSIQPFPQLPQLLPQNWTICDGRSLNVPANQALFSLLGTTFGGDGVNSFQVPNLQPLQPTTGPAIPYCICNDGFFPSPNSRAQHLDYLSRLFPFAGPLPSNLPAGSLPARGEALNLNRNQGLFSLLGTRFGGDGRSTFNLPSPPSLRSGDVDIPLLIVTSGVYPSRE
jgi:microcystin-dependent protein